MNYWDNLGSGIVANSQIVYASIMAYLPKILVALVFALIGLFLAGILKKLTVKGAKSLKLNKVISESNLDEELAEAGIKMNIPVFLGESVKWIVLIITLLFVTGMFPSLNIVQKFIADVLFFIGKFIGAILIFAVAVYAARFAGTIAKAVAKYVDVKNVNAVETVTKFVIYFFALIQVLEVTGANGILSIFYTLIEAILYGAGLAAGIAFGLGGQEKAKEFLDKLKK